MKRYIRAIVPGFLLRNYHRVKRALESRRNVKKTPEQVFSEIYRRGLWGGTGKRFHSGAGSRDDAVVQPYLASIIEYLRGYGSQKPKIVDLGCGDFSVGRQLLEYCSQYVAVDVVPDLIRHLQAIFVDSRLEFRQIDITRDDLPSGDVCLIRQVFQHLSNAQILNVLAKLRQYKVVFITEHYPKDGPQVVPNIDKVHGSTIRLFNSSGVYFDKPPFAVPSTNLELFLEVPDGNCFEEYEAGVIRTFKLTFEE
jgi:SAM-dependent methyltransferase